MKCCQEHKSVCHWWHILRLNIHANKQKLITFMQCSLINAYLLSLLTWLQVKINVEISFFEIYNEKIHDLLASSKEKGGKKPTVSKYLPCPVNGHWPSLPLTLAPTLVVKDSRSNGVLQGERGKETHSQ